MIKQEEFAKRRARLLAETGPGTMLIVASRREVLRNGDSHYPFRQDSDFWYLTGFDEPEAVLVMIPGREAGAQLMFLRECDPERARWDGPRLGLDGARAQLGMDDAFPIHDLDDILPGLMEGCERLYHLIGKDPAFDQRVLSWRNQLRARSKGQKGPGEFVSLEHLLHEQRLIKSSDELRCMRKAAAIAAGAMSRAMRSCRPGMNEAEIQAELLHEYQRNGCAASYQPIIAGGANALVLHYTANNQALPDSGLLLVDAGCEYQNYAADISRSFPVCGRFSPAQRDVYDVVLAAQQAAIDAVRVGRPFDDFHTAAVRVLTQGLIDLKLLQGSVDDAIEQQSFRRFYMHKTGHWLGLDVHDVGDYRIDGESRLLEPNMVVTVEPGLYIGDEDDIPEALRNIGIRIEDDIRVTSKDPENLTKAVPVSCAEIEALMQA